MNLIPISAFPHKEGRSEKIRRKCMTDMLVKLYNLPDHLPAFPTLEPQGIRIRKPLASEKSLVLGWVQEYFGTMWGDEIDVSFAHTPVSAFIAQQGRTLVGFACYDASALGYFGPTGVLDAYRGTGIGKALLLTTLLEMRSKGYGYAIIGWIGPQEFYEKAAGATVIPDSTPGIWKDFLYGVD
jgi:GNAT superfamily N-acetyltransferase